MINSVAKSLFLGKIRTDILFPYPALSLDDHETFQMFKENIDRFGKQKLDEVKIDQEAKISEEILDELKELGFFGMAIPEKYSGVGLSIGMYVRCLEEIAQYSISVVLTLAAHQSIGCKTIMLYGSNEQKKHFLPKLARGEWIASFALTEANAGSDVNAVESKAILNPEGTHYILNGSKQWISNGGLAHVFTVFAKTPEKLSAFLVTRDMKGFSVGKDEEKMGIRGSLTNSLYFNDVAVLKENLLGDLDNGFKIAVNTLNMGRLGLAACCLGGLKTTFNLALEHTRQRQQFGQPIANFEMIRGKLFEISQKIFIMESIIHTTSGLLDAGMDDFALEAAIAKVRASEDSVDVTNQCLQIAGGNGYMKEYPYELYVRDARVSTIFEGTNEILRLMIALLGLNAFGKEFKTFISALKNPFKNLSVIIDYINSELGSLFSSPVKKVIHPSLKKEGKMIDRSARLFYRGVRWTALKYGKKVMEREFQQQRIADSVIDLYAMLCTASRVDQMIREKGVEECESEIFLFKTFCNEASRRIKENLRSLKKNQDRKINQFCKKIIGGGHVQED